jgi:transposase-like protein
LDSNTLFSFGANVPTSRINGIKGEVVVTIKKQQYYLWRAVDAEGNVLDVLLQRHRDPKAERFFGKLLKQQGFVPRVIITDKLKSYAAAKKQVLKGAIASTAQGLKQHLRKLSSANIRCDRDECKNSNHQGKRNDFSLLLD